MLRSLVGSEMCIRDSYKASTENQQGRDDEARVFYVGMTRAKQRLVIVRRTEAQYEYEPIFFYERKAS